MAASSCSVGATPGSDCIPGLRTFGRRHGELGFEECYYDDTSSRHFFHSIIAKRHRDKVEESSRFLGDPRQAAGVHPSVHALHNFEALIGSAM